MAKAFFIIYKISLKYKFGVTFLSLSNRTFIKSFFRYTLYPIAIFSVI